MQNNENNTTCDSPLKSGDNLVFEFCDFSNSEHLNSLTELINHYIADPMGDAEVLNKEQQLSLVNGLANHPTAKVLFAFIDSKVVGLATCFINFSTFYVKPYLYIHDLVVLKEFRQRGVAKSMLNKLFELSVKENYCKITLEVREDNVAAQLLYKSLGFDECDPKMFFWTKKLQ